MVPGILDRPVNEILSFNPDARCYKFVLKTENLRDNAMRSFYNMNITNATLFPDLDGLARSMAYELEFHWGFNPKNHGKVPRLLSDEVRGGIPWPRSISSFVPSLQMVFPGRERVQINV